jgi:hypothetical protein
MSSTPRLTRASTATTRSEYTLLTPSVSSSILDEYLHRRFVSTPPPLAPSFDTTLVGLGLGPIPAYAPLRGALKRDPTNHLIPNESVQRADRALRKILTLDHPSSHDDSEIGFELHLDEAGYIPEYQTHDRESELCQWTWPPSIKSRPLRFKRQAEHYRRLAVEPMPPCPMWSLGEAIDGITCQWDVTASQDVGQEVEYFTVSKDVVKSSSKGYLMSRTFEPRAYDLHGGATCWKEPHSSSELLSTAQGGHIASRCLSDARRLRQAFEDRWLTPTWPEGLDGIEEGVGRVSGEDPLFDIPTLVHRHMLESQRQVERERALAARKARAEWQVWKRISNRWTVTAKEGDHTGCDLLCRMARAR